MGKEAAKEDALRRPKQETSDSSFGTDGGEEESSQCSRDGCVVELVKCTNSMYIRENNDSHKHEVEEDDVICLTDADDPRWNAMQHFFNGRPHQPELQEVKPSMEEDFIWYSNLEGFIAKSMGNLHLGEGGMKEELPEPIDNDGQAEENGVDQQSNSNSFSDSGGSGCTTVQALDAAELENRDSCVVENHRVAPSRFKRSLVGEPRNRTMDGEGRRDKARGRTTAKRQAEARSSGTETIAKKSKGGQRRIELDCDDICREVRERPAGGGVFPLPRVDVYKKEAGDELGLEHLLSVYTGDLGRNPLGAAFDPQLGLYILAATRSGEIRFLTENGKEKSSCISNLNYPSNVIVLEAGRSFAFVDDQRIYKFDFVTGNLQTLADMRQEGRFRSLCALSPNELMTCKIYRNKPLIEVVVFKAGNHDYNMQLQAMVYPFPEDVFRVAKPSFACSLGDGIATVTDLGLHAIFTLCWVGTTRTLHCISRLSVNNSGNIMLDGRVRPIYRISGIAIDADGKLLIADALKRELSIVSSTGRVLQEVKVTNGNFPYTAQIALGRRTLLTCNREAGGFSLFRLVTAERTSRGVQVKRECHTVEIE